MNQPTIQSQQGQHLRFIRFKDLIFWDYQTHLKSEDVTAHRFEVVKLRDAIEHRKEFFMIDDAEVYKRCKVQLYSKGIVLRDIIKGSEIRTKKQQACRTNELLVAEIDAKFGGYGIVPSELNGAIVSSHYFLYEINKSKLLPDFLGLYLKTQEFAKQVQATGSTNYAAIRPYHVLEYTVSLPPLDIQKRIVESYSNIIARAQAYEAKAKEIGQETEIYLLKELGVKIHQAKAKRGLQFVNFKDVTRWAVDFLQHLTSLNDIKKCKYEVIRFGELITSSQYGTSDKAGYKQVGFPMLRMNNISRGELDITNLKFVKIDKNKVNKLLLQKGDLLFNRTNSKELVGKTAVFDLEGDYVFASYLIRLRVDSTQVDVHFVNHLFDSPIIRQQIDMISRQITGLANVNLTELSEFLIPLPPLSIQKKIVERIRALKAEIRHLQADAERLRKEAKMEFEASVFAG